MDRKRPLFRLVRLLLLVLLLGLVVMATAIATFSFRVSQIVGESPSPLTAPAQVMPLPAGSRPLAVVLFSDRGTEITDALPIYELLAASGAFTTVTVAPERRAVPLDSALELPAGIGRVPAGLDLVPQLSFADYAQQVGQPPKLIVIPNLTHFTPEGEQSILEWIRTHAGPETTLLSICSGSRVLAATGLLDGHMATGQHQYLDELEQHYPAVHWQRGVRWAEDGLVITSGTLTAGIDATLYAIAQLGGRAAAVRAAESVGYPHLHRLNDPAADYTPPAESDLGFMPHALSGWGEDALGLILHEGVSETAVAAVLDVSALNLTHVYTLSPGRALVRTRHGLLLAPRYALETALRLDRAIVLSEREDAAAERILSQWAEAARQPTAERIISGPGATFAYDAVIADVAAHAGGAVARSDARNLVYPVAPTLVAGSPLTTRVLALPVSTALLGLALVVRLSWQRDRSARKEHPGAQARN